MDQATESSPVSQPISREEFKAIIDWLSSMKADIDRDGISCGGRTFKAIIKGLTEIYELAGVHGQEGLSGVKPGKGKLDHLYSVANASQHLMSYWATKNGKTKCPRASKYGKLIRFAWDAPNGSRQNSPRRIWVVLPRWFDEYVDEILRGMESMAETLGVGLCTRPVDIDAVDRAIEDIAINHSPLGETLSIVSLMGNPSELKQSDAVARAERHVKTVHKDNMFITTVGRENSDIRLKNEQIGERLAEQMLADLAAAGQLTGKVVLFGTSDKDSSDPYKMRRKRFRITVEQRREDDGRPGNGHQLTMPDLRDIDSDLMFDPSASWKIRELLLEYLESTEGQDVRAVYALSFTTYSPAGFAGSPAD